MPDKVIITNLTALKAKYGASGVTEIKSAITDLIAADKKRGLETVLVAVDDAGGMKKLKASPVTKGADPKQNKVAIDGIYQALTPDYLMILGAIDVIPHQDLKNSMFSPNPLADDEKFAYGDVPYACDAPYSKDVNKFTGPTRVVGRLPDLTGASGSPKYLLNLLKTATNWKSSERSAYQDCLGISAEKWRESTALSMTNIFSSDKDLQTSPKGGSKWKIDLINRRTHFINCHGGDTIPDFYGQSKVQDSNPGPVSHEASFVAKPGNVLEGTVVSAECCFGGQLYDPSAADKGQMGMCNTYLSRKAYGFFGSTTTAYGPFTGNDAADLICQYFLQRVLAGASLGRAALEARQRFVEKCSPLSNMNQKTLAQFNLYGDPSIVPVSVPTSKLAVGPKLIAFATGLTTKRMSLLSAKAEQDTAKADRFERREKLHAKGTMLGALQPEFRKREGGPSKKVQSSMEELMHQLNLSPVDTISYDVATSPSEGWKMLTGLAKGVGKSMAAKQPQTTAFHVCFGVSKSSTAKGKNLTAAGTDRAMKSLKTMTAVKPEDASSRLKDFVVLEAKEVDGKIVSVSQAHSK
ncbi:MAG TPA: hypothetical protein VNG71_01095 [Pyrinomonadaceae bacterium]|nr:hypothetical protein [Pyrinomonadaceae bacterium]